jgi:DNA-binding response OmpR family regulator
MMGAYRDEHLEIDFDRAVAFLDGRRMTLTRKEYELLCMLALNVGEIIPRDVLLMRIWGYSREIRTRTLDVHIRRIRKKLNAYGDLYIETVFGVGYRFQRYRESRPVPAYIGGYVHAVA